MTTWKTFLLAETLLLGTILPACWGGPAFTREPDTVALWNFDEGEGETLKDEGPAGIDLVFRRLTNDTAEPEWIEGKFGKALHFPGRACLKVAFPKGGGIIDTPNEVTVEAWIRLAPRAAITGRAILQHASPSTAGYRMFVNPRNKVDWLISRAGKETGTLGRQELPENDWVHVAGTYDGSFVRIYINGILDAETPLEGGVPLLESLISTFVGYASGAEMPYFEGDIDAIRISNKARTEFPTE